MNERVIGDKNPGNAKDLVRQLRKLLLNRPEGEFFGAEDEILDRFQISRPTLRQAARVLEHEQLLRVKRGPKGGYYVARPDANTVVRSASLYLRDRGTRLRDLIEAASGCLASLIRMAADSENEEARDNLYRELEHFRALDFENIVHKEYLEAEIRLIEAVSALAGNPPLDIIIKILFGCGLNVSSEPIFDGRPDRMRMCAESRIKEVEAILAGDPELAELYYDRARSLRMGYLAELEKADAARVGS